MTRFLCAKIVLIFFLFANFFSVFAAGSGGVSKLRNNTIQIIDKKKYYFENMDCAKNNTCDLKNFSLNVQYYRMWHNTWGGFGPAWDYGVEAVAEYSTDQVSSLETYAVVQFWRGCMFGSDLKEDGSVNKYYDKLIHHFDEEKYYCFPEWTIDSQDKDPVYNSDPLGRHYLYRWNTKTGSHDSKTEILYGNKKPYSPSLYVVDPSSHIFYLDGFARNISLEVRTCIFRTSDVPKETSPENINFADPIKCFDWSISYIYNHALGKFENKTQLDPFCLQKPPKY